MTLKTRLITTISMFFLVIALLITGVWAASSATVNIGGTVSFNATNIYATITGSISGASTTPTLSPLNYSAKSNPGTTELNTWKQNLTFADATIPTIKWTVTIENKSERALYVTLTDNIASLANATKTLTFDGDSADGEQTIPAKTTKVYTMEIKVTDTNASASVEYDFAFDLRDASTQGYTATLSTVLGTATDYNNISYSINGGSFIAVDSSVILLKDVYTIQFSISDSVVGGALTVMIQINNGDNKIISADSGMGPRNTEILSLSSNTEFGITLTNYSGAV